MLRLAVSTAFACTLGCTTPAPAPARVVDAAAREPAPPRFSPAPAAHRLVVVHMADSEAGMLSDPTNLDVGGLARTNAIVMALRARAPASVVVHAGDSIIPSPELQLELTDKLQKQSAVVLGNARLGVDVFAIGNHELDLGEAFLADVVKAANAPYLSATMTATGGPLAALVVDVSGGTPWAFDIKGKIAPRAKLCAGTMKDAACDGLVVGVVGITTEALRAISAGASTALVLPKDRDAVVGVVNAQVRALEAEGITTVIALSHLQGIDRDIDLVHRGLLGVDVIVSAGGENKLATAQHRLAAGDAPDPACARMDGDCYPVTLEANDGAPVIIVATGGDMRYVGNLVIDIDAQGKLTGFDAAQSRPVPVDETSLLELRASVDKDVLALEQRTRKELAPLLAVVGESDVPLEGSREQVRNRETNLGDLSADAILEAARALAPTKEKPAFALRNGGGIRQGIAKGQIRMLDVKAALRFDSKVVVVAPTHRELVDSLEAALIGAGTARGQFPQVSDGVHLAYATDAPELAPRTLDGKVIGVRCAGLRVRTLVVPTLDGATLTIVKDGVVVTPTERVRVATIDYLANGGDGWFPGARLDQIPIVDDKDAPMGEQTALVRFLAGPKWQRGAPYIDGMTRIERVSAPAGLARPCARE